ncbi:hypothetical protein AQ490_21025 [Wenjunlia vitaminophila]|uniref:Uncharacterized protein n=1 Tax=Wenjunlia vitaminophila TaxID=76728 RepID=A0A0T6LUE9_WENVI|nr:hypothetical protein [Wenjunlia vitaminophila]KRV49458.1 hypothetical protein AQ490_21025 [Wenjunlia vitaminophila]
MLTLVVACEVGFWVLLLLGLALRYALGLRRTSTVVLAGVPLVDVVLLVAAVIDLRDGGAASSSHGLAAVYLGFSVGYGHWTISRVDAWAAHRLSGGPKPARPPRYGRARSRYEWALWLRTLVAAAVAGALLQLAVWMVDDPRRTEPLTWWQDRMVAVTVIHLLIAGSYSVWPKPEPERPEGSGRAPGTGAD